MGVAGYVVALPRFPLPNNRDVGGPDVHDTPEPTADELRHRRVTVPSPARRAALARGRHGEKSLPVATQMVVSRPSGSPAVVTRVSTPPWCSRARQRLFAEVVRPVGHTSDVLLQGVNDIVVNYKSGRAHLQPLQPPKGLLSLDASDHGSISILMIRHSL